MVLLKIMTKPEPKKSGYPKEKGSLKKSTRCRFHKDGIHQFMEYREKTIGLGIYDLVCGCGKHHKDLFVACNGCGKIDSWIKIRSQTCLCGMTLWGKSYCESCRPKPIKVAWHNC
jgi:hypothetical protein